MKPVKISQKDYDRYAKYPQIKQLMDQSIASGLLIIKDAPKPPAPTPEPQPPVVAPPLTGYEWDAAKLVIAGMDRDWYKHDAAKVAALAHSCGCNAVSVEMVADDTFAKGNPGAALKPYLALLSECRKRKLVLFVCVVNDWIRSEWWKNMPTLLNIVLQGGPEGVIVQTVAETHTAKGVEFEKDAIARLRSAKFKTCYNGNGGRPTGKNKCDYFAWHSGGANANSTAPSGAIEITDHGDKIRWIGYFDSKKVESLAKSAKARGCGFGLYRYVGMGGSNGSPASLPVEASAASWLAMANVYKTLSYGMVTDDALDISNVIEASTGNIINEERVPITHQLKSAKSDGKYVTLTNDLPSSYYGKDTVNKVTDLARCYIYWQRDGKVYGGHFDWLRPGSTRKELKNASNDYFKVKWKGEQPYFMIVASNGKQRTNVVKG